MTFQGLARSVISERSGSFTSTGAAEAMSHLF
jgi:hypothetical protein